MKKLISILLAIAMIMSFAVAASAAEVADIDCSGWWVAHTEGLEIKAGEVLTVNFTNTTYENAVDPADGLFKNWYGPLYILYTNSEAKVDTTNTSYAEYWVQRGDAYGWGSVAAPVYTWPDYDVWATWEATLKGGAEGTITAYLDGTTAVITMEFAGITSVQNATVDTSKSVYLSLTGDQTNLTDISYSYAPIDDGSDDNEDETPSDDKEDETPSDDKDEEVTDDKKEESTDDKKEETSAPEKEETVDKSYTLPDLDCTGWWVVKSEGIELTEDGVVVNFKSTTYETASNNWNGPLWILYTADEPVVNAAGYVEYWVHRLDNYGWGNNLYYNVTLPADDANAALNTAYPDLLTAAGIKHEASFAESFVWENLVADLKAGIDVTVSAQLVGSNAVITMTGAGITNTMTVPVDTSKPVYLSLTGELNTITNIDVIPNTGDSTNLIALGAAMILAAAGVVTITVGKKKFF